VARTRRALLGTVAAASVGAAGCVGRRRRGDRPTLDTDATARVGFAGDAMLGRSVDATWRDRADAATGVWGSLLPRLERLDGLVANLECTVSDRGRPQPGRVYRFRASPEWALAALERAGADALALANNHQLDYGSAALVDSRRRLVDAGVAVAGAGRDLATAARPATATVGDLNVALVSATDQARGDGAGPERPGVAQLPLAAGYPETREFLGALVERALATDPDLLVASLHWGPNWRERPSPGRRDLARWLIDRGVDVVHGHSAHVVQGVERYRGRPILYDCGDLVDDYVVKPDLRNDRSALFEVVLAEGAVAGVRIVPTEIRAAAVHRARSDAAAWLRERLRARSADLDVEYRRAGDGLWVPIGAARPPDEVKSADDPGAGGRV
jgi:poly-gamma-glutamate capsule biosynthesis protein CapA/YwtB (metallophosphatase superfamily)